MATRLPQPSMATTLSLIALVAVDLAVARALIRNHEGDPDAGLKLGALPMATALLVVGWRLVRVRGRVLPFAIGFLVAGLLASAGVVAALRQWPEVVRPWAACVAGGMVRVMAAVGHPDWEHREPMATAGEVILWGIFVSGPPLVLGLLGGGLARVMIGPGRRPGGTPHAGRARHPGGWWARPGSRRRAGSPRRGRRRWFTT